MFRKYTNGGGIGIKLRRLDRVHFLGVLRRKINLFKIRLYKTWMRSVRRLILIKHNWLKVS